ncbi:MAG: DUF3795 domain-containing protein [Clostridia bacterium]|nr:DUF3795 domain-containing protein [Clostridia bacterium]
MSTICGANCDNCGFKDSCKGCVETCGMPFGGKCIAAEYIKAGGKEAYHEFKIKLISEINGLLDNLGIADTEALYELPGSFVNLEYALDNGTSVKFLDDKRIYLGCQIEFEEMGVCYGVVADTNFILVCSYSMNGSDPELLMYKKR